MQVDRRHREGTTTMRRAQSRLWVLLPLAVVCLRACATVPPDIEPPKINIANIALKDVAVFEQRFDVQLRIQNPNDQELGINGLRFDIELNDKEFGSGMSGQQVKVSRFGSEVVNVEVITGLSSFLRQFQELNKSGVGTLRYRLKGTAFVVSPRSFKLPFDEKGEVDLGLSQSQP
jgi:LEA14-like dessication related protein